jgi:hypothetical protein
MTSVVGASLPAGHEHPARGQAARNRSWVFAVTLFAALAAALAAAQQWSDTTFDTRVARPALIERAPRMLFDEAHHEFHRTAGRYRPFADLARHDGWRVTPNLVPLDSTVLANADLLVIANALGHEDMDRPEAALSAFTPGECAAVEAWVRRGGALLLIADHAPMGDAARPLGEAFGVDMRAAYTLDPERSEGGGKSTLHFRPGKGLHETHPIVAGRDSGERVRHVVAFTGQSLAGPAGSTPILQLSATAEDLLVGLGEAGGHVPPERRRSAAGRAQGLAFEHGRGRVVVLGEAAMCTAQVAGGKRTPMGMNVPGNDDRQFALNTLRWLARAL